jgi:alanyl-tRNA synthetase
VEHDPLEIRALAGAFAGESGFQTRFTGYETERQRTTVGALESISANGAATTGGAGTAAREGAPARYLVKLEESPFYAPGGGQVADGGTIEGRDTGTLARVEDVFRLGDDQALEVVVEEGELGEGEEVLARVDHAARHATECNHTATHLLQAALRERVGGHVRQAGSYVGPDKLRFDFSHGHGLSAEELGDVEDRVNAWILANDPVRPITTTLDEARRLGAMALFGEKYGDVVRMVEIGDGEYSRELCGGTHVRSTAEIGLFHILSETSSAANVRRIEAVTGPEAVALMRERERLLRDVAGTLRVRPEDVPETVRAREQERRQLEKAAKAGSGAPGAAGAVDLEALAGEAVDVGGTPVLAAAVEGTDAKALLDIADRLRGRLGDAAIVLGTAVDGRVHLLASVAPVLVERGLKAGELVKLAAEVVGGGGGGRDTMAQAGGREPEKLGEAIERARTAIESALAG